MKNSVLFLILIIGLVGLGFVVETKFGTITKFLNDYGILESSTQPEDTTGQNSVDQSQASGSSKISIDLPQYFEMSSGRIMATSLIPFETQITSIDKKQSGVSETALTVSQYFSKDDFDKSLEGFLDSNLYGGPGVVSSPQVNYKIGGEDAVEYIFSLYDEDLDLSKEVLAVFHVISIPSELTIINFQDPPQYNINSSLNFELSLSEIKNIISLIRFESGIENKLVSAKKTPEEEAVEKKLTHTEEAFGIVFSLPEGKKIESVPTSESVYDGATKIDRIFILLNQDAGVIVEKYKSKEDFDKPFLQFSEMENKEPKEQGVIYYPVEKYEINGENFIQFHFSVNNVQVYQIFVESKLVSFSFTPQTLEPLYSVDDIKNVIHSVKFNY